MSIINDALKRAEKGKQGSQNRPRQWFVWAGTGLICFLGTILAACFFKQPADSVVVQEAASPKGVSLPAFRLRKTDVETPLNPSGFHLSGVLYDNQRPLAIINDRVVEEGVLINGAKLLEIQPNSVKLSLDGEEFTLKIK